MTKKLLSAVEVEKVVSAFHLAHQLSFEAGERPEKEKHDHQTAMIVLTNLLAAIRKIPNSTPSPGEEAAEVRKDDIKRVLDHMRRAEARCTELEEVLKRLASSEAMTLPFMPNEKSNDGRELLARIDFARATLNPQTEEKGE